MKMLIPFRFNQQDIRVHLDEQGSPWFIANEVCGILDYVNPRDALIRHVDEEDVAKHDTLTDGGIQQINFINESGLYSLIFGSKKAEAKHFKRWVTSQVLPQIRRSGQYGLDDLTKRDTIDLAQLTEVSRQALQLAQVWQLEGAGQRQGAALLVERVTGANPLEWMQVSLAETESHLPPSALAYGLGVRTARLNTRLAELGFQEAIQEGGQTRYRLKEEGKAWGKEAGWKRKSGAAQLYWKPSVLSHLQDLRRASGKPLIWINSMPFGNNKRAWVFCSKRWLPFRAMPSW